MHCQVNWSELNVKGDLQRESVAHSDPTLTNQVTVPLILSLLEQANHAY